MTGIELTDDVLRKIAAAARTIHHGQIIIHLNRDTPKSVDIEITSRDRIEL